MNAKCLSNDQYKVDSLTIAKQLLENSVMKANTIAVTLSNRPEVDTIEIIEKLWNVRKE